MTTATFFIICAIGAVVLLVQTNSLTHALYLTKPNNRDSYNQLRNLQIKDPKKRPFCNAFTGCGRKRSNLPALTDQGDEVDESIGSLLELSAEPAIEDLSRQIMSEAKLWEAIQEANVELNRRRQQASAAAASAAASSHSDEAVPARSATASCALPPCYI